MTEQALAAAIEALVTQARGGGLDDETIIAVLADAVAALNEGLS